MSKTQGAVCCDHQRRTCVQVHKDKDKDLVKYIDLDVINGLAVKTAKVKEFEQRYKPMPTYPVEKACSLYIAYSRVIGATKEALDHLGQFYPITSQEYDMAVSKASATEEKKEAKKSAAKAAAKTPAKTSVKVTKVGPTDKEVTELVPAKVAKPAKVVKAKAEPKPKPKPVGEKKPSASGMFQDLIMEGKLTDSQIFAKVKEEFGLDDSKKGYVKWYRNHLTKQGRNPPAAK